MLTTIDLVCQYFTRKFCHFGAFEHSLYTNIFPTNIRKCLTFVLTQSCHRAWLRRSQLGEIFHRNNATTSDRFISGGVHLASTHSISARLLYWPPLPPAVGLAHSCPLGCGRWSSGWPRWHLSASCRCPPSSCSLCRSQMHCTQIRKQKYSELRLQLNHESAKYHPKYPACITGENTFYYTWRINEWMTDCDVFLLEA